MKTKIGGQAVLEGVMMRGQASMALAVRDEQGTIRLDTKRFAAKKPWYKKVPFLRGVINLVTSMIDGMKILSKSAEVLVEDEVDSQKGMGAMMAVAGLLGVALAVFLFVFLPTKLTEFIMNTAGIEDVDWVRSLIEGVLKLLVLVGYMSVVTLMEDIKRVYMYHGAEHKTISCFEDELPLTVENVQKSSRYHDRCGTSFIVFVVVMSVLLMFGVEAICFAAGFEAIKITWVRTLIKLAMLPLTAGLSYEMLMLLAKSNFVLFVPFKWLGKQFQRLTTREPDDEMCEVAIAAFNAVLQMETDPTVAEVHFPPPVPFNEFKQSVSELSDSKKVNAKDIDLIISEVIKPKKGVKEEDVTVPFGCQLRVQSMLKRAAAGEPMAYVMGSIEFFGKKFFVDKSVLIPRLETELVCEQAVKVVREGAKVLDLCCGSGVLGITLALEKSAEVMLCDISGDALAVAKKNAKQLKVKNVKIVQSDMFENVNGKFDLIISNPPYVVSGEIDTLDGSVKNYEPRIALDGGEDGLKFYRVIAQNAQKYLNTDGKLVLEVGYNQGRAVKSLLTQAGFTSVEVKADYGGNDRIVTALR